MSHTFCVRDRISSADIRGWSQYNLGRSDCGISQERIILDPGIGFGKTLGHNLFLLRHLAELRVLGAPVLVGTSRKRFIGVLSGGRPPEQRLPGSLASVAAVAVLHGADVVRVHDVAEAMDALAVADAIARAREGGDLWGPPRS